MSKAHLGTYLRTQPTWEAYKNAPKRNAKECFLCSWQEMELVQEFDYWLIVKNQYPYDAVAEVHHMLVPFDHWKHEEEVSDVAGEEIESILEDLDKDGSYDCIMRNFAVGQSHPTHLHYHLIRWKRHSN